LEYQTNKRPGQRTLGSKPMYVTDGAVERHHAVGSREEQQRVDEGWLPLSLSRPRMAKTRSWLA